MNVALAKMNLDLSQMSPDLWFSDDDDDDDYSNSSDESNLSRDFHDEREAELQKNSFEMEKQGSDSTVCSSDMSDISQTISRREFRHHYHKDSDSARQRTKLSLLLDQKIAAKLQRALQEEQSTESSI
eukprot:CAMPEP_0183725900 /NCGR_PEP_ID=MMETSP0737-20130205/21888_1 /TAXON_ID=385413 /ORGANISM="Thalassiosira miniscula, Strain CCMP1093" /LENGTH=127 /DNA_ID=CAMNT_0025957063 /DNA_START=412 /DNA_END=795 /DNA_ORIENTATION=-